LDLIKQYGEFGFLSPTRLMMARALLDYPDPDTAEAEAELHRCLDCAQSQGGKMIELRAATTLARLWQTQGKTRKAHDLLKPVYDWFTEGFETPDLKEAKALLDAAP
jgi:predicted ATPase